ncbi:MAG: Bifunctional ligase/repressor BirA [Chlamydiae bacterium]|nr:Bifunctional ligase/repressor BirA [Chlamydiota bacterium]
MEIKHHHFNKLESTQDWAKDNYESFDLKKFHVISANEQSKGRGRFDRNWHSPHGGGAYATYCFLVSEHSHPLNPISLVTGLTFAEVLQKLGLIVKLKWPNDIFINDKKAGGILVETKETTKGKVFFVGVGLNINMDANQLVNIDCPATSVQVETRKTWGIKSIMNPAESLFQRNLEIFLKEGFTAFQPDFESLSFLAGKTILMDHGKESAEGIYHGVDETGAIVLQLKDKTLKAFHSGEITSWE